MSRSDQNQAVQMSISPLASLVQVNPSAVGNATHQARSQGVVFDPSSPRLLPVSGPSAPRSDRGRRAAAEPTARRSTTTQFTSLSLNHTSNDTNSSPLARSSVGIPAASSNLPCSICLEVLDEFPHVRPASSCTHPSTICASCLEQHISHAVLTQGSTTLSCPDPECRQALEYEDVVRIARNDRVCLDRYEALLLRRTLENEPNFVWCKNPICSWGQLHEGGDAAPIVICQVCDARACFTHDVPWHTDLTCEQYNAQRNKLETQNQASEAYIGRHAKPCPNTSCGRRIEKSHGCDHMTCRRPVGCGHEFCWACLADYDPIRRDGNHRHRPTCPHYAAFDPSTPANARFLRHRDRDPPLSQAQIRARVAETRTRRMPQQNRNEIPPPLTARVSPAVLAASAPPARIRPLARTSPAASRPTRPVPPVPAARGTPAAPAASTSAHTQPLTHTSSAPSRSANSIPRVPAAPSTISTRAGTTSTIRVNPPAPRTYAFPHPSITPTSRPPIVRIPPVAPNPPVRVPPAASTPVARPSPTISPPAAPSSSVSITPIAQRSWLDWLWGINMY